ncbi:MAG: 30S ribosomal protein S12 methylthiotransferase RimO, partial [Spirochaetaceae bacterium]|nr:30S ribosomal protein S12 methylthiotransferase RimO [Spirochaetaceae bacterium]
MTSFFLDQHGCAKNQIDGELILTRLLHKGMKRVNTPEEADLIIVNSCGFIESAKRESLEAVIDAKTSYPHAKVLLAGCLSERYAESLAEDLPEADGIIGNGD